MYCVMRASVPSLYNVYRRYGMRMKLVSSFCYSVLIFVYFVSLKEHDLFLSQHTIARAVSALCACISL